MVKTMESFFLLNLRLFQNLAKSLNFLRSLIIYLCYICKILDNNWPGSLYHVVRILHMQVPFTSFTWAYTVGSSGSPHQMAFFTLQSNFWKYLLLSKMLFAFHLGSSISDLFSNAFYWHIWSSQPVFPVLLFQQELSQGEQEGECSLASSAKLCEAAPELTGREVAA